MNTPDLSKLTVTDVVNWIELGVAEIPDLVSLGHTLMDAINRRMAADLAAARAGVQAADIAADAAEAAKFGPPTKT